MQTVSDDWFSIKIYAEPSSQNRIILEVVSPLLDYYVHQGMLKDWFFIRYSDRSEAREFLTTADNLEKSAQFVSGDPGYHLRIRACVVPASSSTIREALTDRLTQACLAGNGERWCEFPYRPEIDRYGGSAGMRLAHKIFALNSQDVIALLRCSAAKPATEATLRLGDELLQSLGLTREARRALYLRRFQWLASRCQLDMTDYQHLERLSASKHRQFREIVAQTTSTMFANYSFLQRNEELHEIGAAFARLEAENHLTFPRVDIFAALHHLHNNRVGYSTWKELSTLYCLSRWLINDMS